MPKYTNLEEFDGLFGNDPYVTVLYGYPRMERTKREMLDDVQFVGGIARDVANQQVRLWLALPTPPRILVVANDAPEAVWHDDADPLDTITPLVFPEPNERPSALVLYAALGPVALQDYALDLMHYVDMLNAYRHSREAWRMRMADVHMEALGKEPPDVG